MNIESEEYDVLDDSKEKDNMRQHINLLINKKKEAIIESEQFTSNMQNLIEVNRLIGSEIMVEERVKAT